MEGVSEEEDPAFANYQLNFSDDSWSPDFSDQDTAPRHTDEYLRPIKFQFNHRTAWSRRPFRSRTGPGGANRPMPQLNRGHGVSGPIISEPPSRPGVPALTQESRQLPSTLVPRSTWQMVAGAPTARNPSSGTGTLLPWSNSQSTSSRAVVPSQESTSGPRGTTSSFRYLQGMAGAPWLDYFSQRHPRQTSGRRLQLPNPTPMLEEESGINYMEPTAMPRPMVSQRDATSQNFWKKSSTSPITAQVNTIDGIVSHWDLPARQPRDWDAMLELGPTQGQGSSPHVIGPTARVGMSSNRRPRRSHSSSHSQSSAMTSTQMPLDQQRQADPWDLVTVLPQARAPPTPWSLSSSAQLVNHPNAQPHAQHRPQHVQRPLPRDNLSEELLYLREHAGLNRRTPLQPAARAPRTRQRLLERNYRWVLMPEISSESSNESDLDDDLRPLLPTRWNSQPELNEDQVRVLHPPQAPRALPPLTATQRLLAFLGNDALLRRVYEQRAQRQPGDVSREQVSQSRPSLPFWPAPRSYRTLQTPSRPRLI